MKGILNKTELVHPIFLMIPIGFLGIANFSLSDLWEKDFNELIPSILFVILSYLILNALNTSQVVAIKNTEIIKGIYCAPFGFLKTNKRISISDIKETVIQQNEKLYFEILIVSKTNNTLLVSSIANKIPAEKELKRIQTEIKTFVKKG